MIEFLDNEKESSLSIENEAFILEKNPEIASLYSQMNENLEDLFAMIIEEGIF